MISADTVNKIFVELFCSDNNIDLKEGAIYEFMKAVAKDGTSTAETLGSVISGIIEGK